MSIRRTFGLLMLGLVLNGTKAVAQLGIRYGVQHEKVTGADLGTDLNMVLGWDFDLNERLSGGLDFSTDMRWSKQYSMPVQALGTANYAERVRSIGVQYRSQYHFMDNDGTSLYLGPTIGLRAVRQMIEYSEEVFNIGWGTSYIQRERKDNGLLFPLGLRVGVRGTLDGGYADLYVAVGTNLGSNEPICDLPFLVDESMPNKTFFQAGFCYGIGW